MSLESQRISPARLAWIMDVSESTVEEWIRQGLIASFKVGRVRRFAPEDVLAFIASYTRKSPKSGNGRWQIADGKGFGEAAWERIERLICETLKAEMLKAEIPRPERELAA